MHEGAGNTVCGTDRAARAAAVGTGGVVAPGGTSVSIAPSPCFHAIEYGGVAVKLANEETEALKLTGGDRADYVRAMQKLREWKPGANLHLAVADYVAALRRLPEHVSLNEALGFYLKRHSIGLPAKTVREVMDELIASKASAGRSGVYIKDLPYSIYRNPHRFHQSLLDAVPAG